jgi:xanthine dehydrogenase accessory factor
MELPSPGSGVCHDMQRRGCDTEMIRNELAIRVEQLIAQRQPFVMATVVRARRPTSVRPGDNAVVLSDGTIEGFVGGVCAASSVRLQSLRALETGDPLLLRLVPGDDEVDAPGETIEGAVVERNPCLSGGALEIFLEPHLPAARLVIIGDSPIAHSLERVGAAAGYDCRLERVGDIDSVDGAAAVVVASHGKGEEAVLAAALTTGVPYVALVASAKRGAIVREELEVPDQLRPQLRTPAGLEIGARSPGEIAISILAEFVAQQHSHPAPAGLAETEVEVPSAVTVATDPVCGMEVAISAATPQVRVGQESVFFCCEGCRDKFAREHSEAVVTR